jgi:tetratricopeptide (TPR) repeat protein
MNPTPHARQPRLVAWLATTAARRRLHRDRPAGSQADLLGREAGVAALARLHGQPGGPRTAELVSALHLLADGHREQAQLPAALTALHRAYALTAQLPAGSARNAALLHTQIRRGDARRVLGDPGAESDLREAVALADAPAVGPRDRALALNALGILCKDTGRLDEAETLYLRALQMIPDAADADAGPGPGLEPAIRHNLAGLAHARGHHRDGEEQIRRALALRDPTDTAGLLADRGVLAALWAAQDRTADAEQLFADLARRWTVRYGPTHYEVGFCHRHLAELALGRGDRHAAAEHYRRALAITRASLGFRHPEITAIQQALDQVAGPTRR